MPGFEKSHHINIKVDMQMANTSDIDCFYHDLAKALEGYHKPGTTIALSIDSTIILP